MNQDQCPGQFFRSYQFLNPVKGQDGRIFIGMYSGHGGQNLARFSAVDDCNWNLGGRVLACRHFQEAADDLARPGSQLTHPEDFILHRPSFGPGRQDKIQE